MQDCPLCSPDLEPVLYEGTQWRLVLNRDQRLLGKCFVVTRRHLEAVAELTPEEWSELHLLLARVTRVLFAAFRPAHFNYAFLQNQDRHVHLHVIPRYAGQRSFAGLSFADRDYPAHYRVPAAARCLAPEPFHKLAQSLKRAMRDEACLTNQQEQDDELELGPLVGIHGIS